MLVYITNFNRKRIVENSDLSNLSMEQEVYSREINFFSEFEKLELLAFKTMSSNSTEFFNTCKLILPVKNNFILEVTSPSYHKNQNCEMLHNNFVNIKISDEIKLRNIEDRVRTYAINQYRILRVEHFNSPRLSVYQALARSIRQHFNLENGLDIVEIENSGIGEINNLDSCRDNIEVILNEIVALREDPDYDTIINIYGTDSFKSMGDFLTYPNSETKNKVKRFHEDYKLPLIDNLKEYYRFVSVSNSNFNSFDLANIGFTHCSACLPNLSDELVIDNMSLPELYEISVLAEIEVDGIDVILQEDRKQLKLIGNDGRYFFTKIKNYNPNNANSRFKLTVEKSKYTLLSKKIKKDEKHVFAESLD